VLDDVLYTVTQMELIGFLKLFFPPLDVPGRFFSYPIKPYNIAGEESFKSQFYHSLAELNSLLLPPPFPIMTVG